MHHFSPFYCLSVSLLVLFTLAVDLSNNINMLFFSLHVINQAFLLPLLSVPPFTTDPNTSLLTPPPPPMKSMQRAASSDTLSMMVFSNADARSHSSAPQHDVKQPLSHSQSMVLPENGKVLHTTVGKPLFVEHHSYVQQFKVHCRVKTEHLKH